MLGLSRAKTLAFAFSGFALAIVVVSLALSVSEIAMYAQDEILGGKIASLRAVSSQSFLDVAAFVLIALLIAALVSFAVARRLETRLLGLANLLQGNVHR